MFGRSSDQKTEDHRLRGATPAPGTREATAVTVAPGVGLPARPADETVVAADDRFEGKLKSSRGVRILGTVDGSIESASHVHIEQNAKVSADVTADEVVIGGLYSGKLVCRQRLEILPTGRVNGSIDTVKLMLHEGGYVDGELHMQKPASPAPAEAPRAGEGMQRTGEAMPRSSESMQRPTDASPRTIGAMRSTVEPSIRQAGAPSGGGSGQAAGSETAGPAASTTAGSAGLTRR